MDKCRVGKKNKEKERKRNTEAKKDMKVLRAKKEIGTDKRGQE